MTSEVDSTIWGLHLCVALFNFYFNCPCSGSSSSGSSFWEFYLLIVVRTGRCGRLVILHLCACLSVFSALRNKQRTNIKQKVLCFKCDLIDWLLYTLAFGACLETTFNASHSKLDFLSLSQFWGTTLIKIRRMNKRK